MDALPPSASRLRIDRAALIANWRWLAARQPGAACAGVVKANAYGLGANEAVQALQAAGCRDFFVSNWREAGALLPTLHAPARLAVLHGVGADDMAAAVASPARPVLCSAEQVARWRPTGRPCDVMVDTGMNRLGVDPAMVAAGGLDGLDIDTLHSHLACADEDSPMNQRQRDSFAALVARQRPSRAALANSAGICLGESYGFDLTRPGIALYGGIVHPLQQGGIRPVARIEARILHRRDVPEGATVGYGARWTARRPSRLATVQLGYADGWPVTLTGRASAMNGACAMVGRVSMDLTVFDVTDAPDVSEDDWLPIDFDLGQTSSASGRSVYEVLTALGARFERRWE